MCKVMKTHECMQTFFINAIRKPFHVSGSRHANWLPLNSSQSLSQSSSAAFMPPPLAAHTVLGSFPTHLNISPYAIAVRTQQTLLHIG